MELLDVFVQGVRRLKDVVAGAARELWGAGSYGGRLLREGVQEMVKVAQVVLEEKKTKFSSQSKAPNQREKQHGEHRSELNKKTFKHHESYHFMSIVSIYCWLFRLSRRYNNNIVDGSKLK